MRSDDAVVLLEQGLVALEDYVHGTYPRPDLEKAIREVGDGYVALRDAMLAGDELPSTWTETLDHEGQT